MPYKSNSRTLIKVRDPEKEITELKKTVDGVKTTVDAVDKSIKDEVWKNTFIETTDADGNVIKKRLEDVLIQHNITLEGINQNVTSYVADLLGKEFIEYNESIREHIANAITDSVIDYVTGESSYVNQKANQIVNVVGKNLFETINVRYIRDWLFSNDQDLENRFAECKVFTSDGANAAKGIIPSAYDSNLTLMPDVENLIYYTDETVNADYICSPDVSMLQLDLGEIRTDIDNIQLYHYYADNRKNKSKLEISTDGKNWISVYDSDIDGMYTETSGGRTHKIQSQVLSEQISFLKQSLKTINLTVQESVGNYSSIIQDMNSIQETIQKTEDDMTTLVKQVSNVDEGWKVSMKKIGAYQGTDIPEIETCLSLNEQGVTVTSSDKKGSKVVIRGNEFTGTYNEGLADSQDVEVFRLDKDTVVAERLKANRGADFNKMKIIPVTYSTFGGLAIIKSGGES